MCAVHTSTAHTVQQNTIARAVCYGGGCYLVLLAALYLFVHLDHVGHVSYPKQITRGVWFDLWRAGVLPHHACTCAVCIVYVSLRCGVWPKTKK